MIQQAIESRRPVQIKYWGGRNPGSVRTVTIVDWKETNISFFTRDVVPSASGTTTELKTYLVIKIASIVVA